jgi:hypothetical protein
MQMRFGGAAGPIAFERMRRMHNGSWDTITVPMGLALRTSSLLEPLAAPGCALVEERFHQFANGRDAPNDTVDGSASRHGEELSGKLLAPLSPSDVPDVDYDRNDEKFVLRKNLFDPPYHTRLWKIELG